jgi:hypothetical protein
MSDSDSDTSSDSDSDSDSDWDGVYLDLEDGGAEPQLLLMPAGGELRVGENTLWVVVTALGGWRSCQYRLDVTRRAPAASATLLSLSLRTVEGTALPLDASFAADTHTYTAEVPRVASAVVVEAHGAVRGPAATRPSPERLERERERERERGEREDERPGTTVMLCTPPVDFCLAHSGLERARRLHCFLIIPYTAPLEPPASNSPSPPRQG